MNKEQETITIRKEFYDELLESTVILDLLNLGGVKKWEGYHNCFPVAWFDKKAKKNAQ